MRPQQMPHQVAADRNLAHRTQTALRLPLLYRRPIRTQRREFPTNVVSQLADELPHVAKRVLPGAGTIRRPLQPVEDPPQVAVKIKRHWQPPASPSLRTSRTRT